MSVTNHVGLWNHCLEIIRDNISEQAYKTWFCPIVPIQYKDKTLTLQVPSQFFYEFLEEKFLDLLSQTIHKVFGEGTKLMYNVMVVKEPPTKIPLPPHPVSTHPQVPTTTPRKQETRNIPQTPQIAELDSHLNNNYRFENFIEGDSNKLSRSVAEAVALNPGKTAFNPLFFYGASGVGKTHLANAIGTKIKELYPEKRVLYVSAHLFQVQYTESVRNNTTNDFIKFYQGIDVLIIDDIQEFAGVTRTQNQFFYIFNYLHQSGKQLILTSDRAPILLQGMEERLITRFKWGMVAELEKPNIELRRNILRNKIRRDGLQFPPEVIDYIAENVSDSVRDLEGTIIAIMAYSTVYNKDVDLELAQRIVRKAMNTPNDDKTISIDNILKAVSNHFGLDTSLLQSKVKKREVVQARQVAMYLAKQNTNLSTAKIGAMIGGRDHATVLHACKVVKGLREVNKTFSSDLDKILASLKR